MARFWLIYDDSCSFCTKIAREAVRRDVFDRITAVGLSKIASLEIPDLPPREVLMQQLILIDENGEIAGGADAVAKLAAALPSTAGIGRLLSLPGIKQMARMAYRAVARSRYRLSRLLRLA